MDSEMLLRQYEALLPENRILKVENLALKARLGLGEPVSDGHSPAEEIEDLG